MYNSKLAFYSLTGITFPYDTMTDNHMGISSVIPVTGVIPYTAVSEVNSFFDYLKTLEVTLTLSMIYTTSLHTGYLQDNIIKSKV